MTMTKIPSRKTWYTYGHGPLIFLFQLSRRSLPLVNLVDVSDIFIFFCSGMGKGSPGDREREGGGRFFIENRRRGGLSQERGYTGRRVKQVQCGKLAF